MGALLVLPKYCKSLKRAIDCCVTRSAIYGTWLVQHALLSQPDSEHVLWL